MIITDPRKYIAWWLSINKIVIDERGNLNSSDKRDDFDLFDTLVLDYYEQIDAFNKEADKKVRACPETNLKKALDEFISYKMAEHRAQIAENIKFSGIENLEPLKAYVTALTGKAESKVVGVMAHFLWQIKRRLIDKEIVYHIMPIFVGAQGGGKSYALRKLLRPLSNLTLELTLMEVTDPRFYFSFNRNFVGILDEMAGANKTEVENLKKQITASYNDVRKLHTNIVTKIKQNASFIGTSNRPVNEIIFDPTGSRRFYQVKALDKLDWEAVNSIDYMALFKGINENLERGYLEAVLEEVKEDQKELVGIDELDSFIEQYKILPGTKEVTSLEIYSAYRIWAELNGIKNPRNSIWLGRRLVNRGLSNKVKKIRGKTIRVYYICEDSEILKKTFDPVGAETVDTWE